MYAWWLANFAYPNVFSASLWLVWIKRFFYEVLSSLFLLGKCTVKSIEVTYQAVFHDQMKHREESWKYDAEQSIFDELRGVSSGDETEANAWYYFSNKMILVGEIKDTKTSSFSSDFQTALNINFLCIFFSNY